MCLKEKDPVQQFKMQNKSYLPEKGIHINAYDSPRLQIVMENMRQLKQNQKVFLSLLGALRLKDTRVVRQLILILFLIGHSGKSVRICTYSS